jgi:hypothetical protein
VRSRHLPVSDRLSVLAATILLAYAASRFVDLPARSYAVQFPGLYLAIDINVRTIIGLLVAGLTASGADWLIRDHPARKGKSTLEHWLVPALTAGVIGVPLYGLPLGLAWLVGFIVGGALLMLVLLAEYIVVDPEDERYSLAAAGLTAVSFALYLMLAIALRSTGLRLFYLMPIMTLAGGLVALRTLHLRIRNQWAFMQSGALALIIAQITTSLHYLPLSPITYGLALIGPAYALTNLIGSLTEGATFRQSITEPLLVLIIVWGTAAWTR